ncbi:hypothetical protein [Lysobacter terrae]
MKQLTLLLGALFIAGAAQAAQPQANPSPAPNADAAAASQDAAKKTDMDDRHCLRYTGTRITHRSDERSDGKKQRMCSNGQIGRAYTREDLDRTGRIDIADALRTLDPSIH